MTLEQQELCIGEVLLGDQVANVIATVTENSFETVTIYMSGFIYMKTKLTDLYVMLLSLTAVFPYPGSYTRMPYSV